jgi:ribose transport system substrate-binding protein
MRPTAKTLGILVVSLAGLTLSCQTSIHSNERYVFVATNIAIPYWQAVQTGFMDSVKALGAQGEFAGPPRYAPEEELKTFQDAVASHPTGILVSPARPDLFQSAIDSAVAAGIPVITVDSDAPVSHRALFVGTDNFRAGMESGAQIAEVLHGRGRVVVVSIPGQGNQEERARGVTEALKKYPFMSVSRVVNDSGDTQQATDLVAGLLQNKEPIDGIVCLEASGGPGVAKALDNQGMAGKIPVVAMDANPETLDLISKGEIAATVAQKPYTMGFYGLRFLDDLHHNSVHEFPDWHTAPVSPLPSTVDTGTVVVNSKNLQDFLAATARPKS